MRLTHGETEIRAWLVWDQLSKHSAWEVEVSEKGATMIRLSSRSLSHLASVIEELLTTRYTREANEYAPVFLGLLADLANPPEEYQRNGR